MGKSEQNVEHLAVRLTKEILDHPDTPNAEACIDLLGELKKLKITMALLETSKIGKLLTKSVKTFKRHKRTESTSGGGAAKQWERAIELSTDLLETWKKIADKEIKSKTAKKTQNAKLPGLPKNASEYRVRLVTHKKEMYKDPPVLPPPAIIVESEKCPLPKRNKASGELSFVCGEDTAIKALLKDFHPNRTPEGTILLCSEKRYTQLGFVLQTLIYFSFRMNAPYNYATFLVFFDQNGYSFAVPILSYFSLLPKTFCEQDPSEAPISGRS